MTPEEFFERFEGGLEPDTGVLGLSIHKARRGWKVATKGRVAWGDTIPDAIQGAFDYLTNAPSRHAALQQPCFKGDGDRIRMSYDYRTTDWNLGDERE